MHFDQNHSLLNYNTFGLDVKTKYFFEFDSEENLIEALQHNDVKENLLLVIGQGSNLLFLNDFNGVVLHSAIRGIKLIEETEDAVLIEVGSGVIWDDLVAYCVQQRWSGIENLSLIPGETGAAAIQNIGAYGVEFKDVVQKVKTIQIADGQSCDFYLKACHYAYRESIFKKELKGQYIVTSVLLRLSKKPLFNLSYNHLENEVLKNGEINLENIRKTIIQIRESKLPDPKVLGNAGSFFMNPVVSREIFESLQLHFPAMPHYYVSQQEEKIPAGWLIEQCGWKGRTIGNVGVHAKQALVLVNYGGAKGKEIAELAVMIQQSVANKFGINLIPEVNFIS
ncbi:MAG: UDP-N-acetylmuramate dehydrogenase [Paludibacter sp.]|nr:UDP-N-acetylmuramate dehydrogenase [Paludibacter sp.]